jgi:hypothetical protein
LWPGFGHRIRDSECRIGVSEAGGYMRALSQRDETSLVMAFTP